MPAESASHGRRGPLVLALLAASAGLAVFALLAHRGLPGIAFAGAALLVASAAIGSSLGGDARPARLLGWSGFSRTTAVWCVVGAVTGAGAGMLHRAGMGIPAWPAGGAGPFVAVACLIGATEEGVYRGWLQGAASRFGWPAAVAMAAVAHATYKTALFAWPAAAVASDLPSIAVWTVAGGLVLGLLREASGSVVPCMAAHAAFDFVVYGAVAHAPWWVWS